MKFVDCAYFIADVGVVVEPESGEFWEERSGNMGEGMEGTAVGTAEENE